MAEAADATKSPWRILVVDDERSVHAVLGRLFQKMGHPIRSVESGPDAMALLGESWDLFVIDKNLPQGNGIDTAIACRKAHPEAVIVMLTGFATAESAAALVGIADEYITKPFELDHLKQTVEALMDLRLKGRQVGALGAVAASPAKPSSPGASPSSSPSPSSPTAATAPSLSASSPSGLRAAPPFATITPRPSSPSSAAAARPAARAGGTGPKLHIVLTDVRDEATLLGAARLAGLFARSGPLPDDGQADVLILDGKSATFELRKTVWSCLAVNPGFRVVMIMEPTALGDNTAAVALKAMARLLRPVSPEAAADLMVKLKKER